MNRLLLCLLALAVTTCLAFAGEIGYIEDFALAKDRAESLKKLIPGTEDYYYYHCLHYLSSEQYEKAEAMWKPWLERFGHTPRFTEIQTRHALLIYDKNPERTLAYLRQKLSLHFNHQKETSDGPPNLPTALDPRLIARARLLAHSLGNWQNLDNFEDAALDWLAAENLNWQRRRNLLQRLQRPDLANLPKLVADDLQADHPQPFGSFAIHRQMTLAQLDELLKLRPSLLNESAFVHAWMSKLHPGADEDWRHDPAKTRAYLDRLLGFVRRLAPAHNALKAHVLYHRLVLDRSQGSYDRELFDEYLKLPRQQPYMSRALLEAVESQRYPANLGQDFAGVTMLSMVGYDEPLVRSYLKHFLVSAESARPFEPYINDVYLRHLFAETKIEAGLGDAELWASQLPPELFRQLKERIDIDFAFTNKTAFGAEEPVKLDLFVKNVPTLLVKVYEINTQNFYRTHRREVDTDINLDGLVANAEKTHTYTEPALRRLGRKFEFPELNKPGVYVIDFIGSGKSSRALVRKGRLRPLVAPSTAGQRVTIVDDADRQVKDATLWLGGAEYKADADGSILVPFSTNPGRQAIVVSRGEFACLDYLEHQPEGYQLKAGIHVDRESLLTQRLATLLVRPGLYLNGQPVALKLLEEVRLRITATDHDGIASATELPDFKLFEDRESTHEFRVPPRLASLRVELLAKVKSLSLNKQIDLATADAFNLNGITKTEKVEDLHLAKFGPDYMIELLGRTGEIKVDRPVQLALKHRDFKEPVHVTLKTDALGRVRLGALPEITNVTATGPEGTAHTWRLPTDQFTYRRLIHARAGEVVAVPYVGSAAAPTRAEFALFELRGEVVQADRFEAIALRDGLIELRGLAAGDYDLWLKRDGEKFRLRVVDGPAVGEHVLGKLRHMELPGLKPVSIQKIDSDAESVSVRLRDASKFARVHVFATRYQPEFSAFRDLGEIRDAELQGVLPAHAESVYLTGRNIGDEYRYILDRKYAKKYPGNMLEKPALLLNPWILRSTEAGEQMPVGGDSFAPKGEPRGSRILEGGGEGKGAGVGHGVRQDLSPNLDFLADASAVLINLVPDTTGVVKIPRKQLGPHAMIHVVAVDPLHTAYRTTTLAEQPAAFADLRLKQGLDPKAHFTQQKQISVLNPNQAFVLADAIGGRFEAYDSLPRVYALYATLSKDPKLAEFAFILNWPKLKAEEKQKLYSKYACHELHFFLAKKDPEFFRMSVRPYLANKKDKTFLDRWLLEEDLSEYLRPWEFARLNTVERALLAQRIQGEPANTQRHLGDLLRLVPPNPDRFLMLFETAVKGSALASEGKPWAREQMQEKFNQRLNDRTPDMLRAQPAPATAAPAAPGGGAGGGGFGRPADSPAKKELESKMKNGAVRFREAGGKDAEKESGESLKRLGDRKAGDPRGVFVDEERLGASFHEDDRARAKLPAQLYRKLDVTQEWAENNYYHLPIRQQLADLVPVSDFWLDYVKHDGKSPFLSRHLADASKNFTEMMFALAVLDLPFTPGKPDVKFAEGKMTFTPAGPAIAFHEEVKPAGPAGAVQILASQNFYRLGDRYFDEGGERFDKFVTNEFVIHTVYGGHIVVTNPTSARQKLSVLIQTPVGSIPVSNGQPTRTVLLDLEPYRTQTIDYFFYFPKAGRFAHFPVHVAKAEALVASAQPFEFNVVEKPSRVDTQAWAYVSQHGSNEQVLAFLNRENVNALDLEKIAFRMKDRDFFNTVIQLLKSRHVYHPTLWSYGLLHNATPIAREFLTHAEQIVQECGGPIVSPLLVIDPVARHQYEHLEYKPLVNARAHSLGKERQIVNNRFNEHYHQYMKLLSYRKQLTDDDKLAVAYYLLLQDRIDEAQATFNQVNPEAVATKVQYDYCAAHLQLYSDEPLKARPIASRHANHPVDRWRNAFAALKNQLDEIEGNGGAKIADVENREQRQGSLAANEPSVEFTIDAKTINLSLANVEHVRLNFYLMDVELLFSRNPFVQQSGGQFSSIKPNFTQDIKVPAGQNQLAVKLPDVLLKRNLLVEATAGGKTRTLPYYANAMEVKLTENYGQLRVTDNATGKPLPKAYVKAYARLADGTVKFYKDGYTDHRGRFDYASVSTPEKAPVVRFSLLVLSDEHGALIREATPPVQ
jgi:transcription termination factor NusB